MVPPLEVHLEDIHNGDGEVGFVMGIYPEGYPDDFLLEIQPVWNIRDDSSLVYKTALVKGDGSDEGLLWSAIFGAVLTVNEGMNDLDDYTIVEDSIPDFPEPERGAVLVDNDGRQVIQG